MQIATLNYKYDPIPNNFDLKKTRRINRNASSVHPNDQRRSTKSSNTLPPIKKHSEIIKKRQEQPSQSHMRIQGNSVISNLTDKSSVSFHNSHRYPPSRSRSRESNYSGSLGRSRSTSPSGNQHGSRGPTRSNSILMHKLKFGYPITLRPSNFYSNDKSDAELSEREESFVNDSIRSANESRQAPIIPKYDPLDDPHLRKFFQSPMVLDVVRKTLSIEYSPQKTLTRRKTKKKVQHNTSFSEEIVANDYLRINTKGSSGYAKLNGYDCIPHYAPARRRHSSRLDNSFIHERQKSREDSHSHEKDNTKQQNYVQKHRSSKLKNIKHQSVDSSLTSFPTTTSSLIHPNNNLNMNGVISKPEKRKRNGDGKEKLTPVATSSPLRQLPKTTLLLIKQKQNDTDDNENEKINPIATTTTHEVEEKKEEKDA
ncbi:unnamed protein product [Didymodactylos carnosus]|uniref:Uncharacterized protein n=1 Tax=Didymodactylos carnosus TaxID=1234261 RepID=A0A814A7A1_9BILA|nr:unnamed protein product [Didymodactylos carnosus]CAF0910089.1 unnamed protein product [Didymodactylos carnosus]CAF3509171.1 unnamed protein product [Didymodactylos carnosus]CAF3691343.1 unnamed protein product [Didymodactylos carnosus]